MASPESSDKGPSWARIVTPDGYSFIVARKVVNSSAYFAAALKGDSGFSESASHTCSLNERGAVSQVLVEYYAYKAQWSRMKNATVPDFSSRIPPELALEILAAVHYLDP